MIDKKDVISGKLDGEIVYICDLRYDNYENKPIRNIRPTKVLVRNNSETTKPIYYSNSHFVGLNKKGKIIKSKIYSLFDSTGYRSRTGTPLNCFKTEKECKDCYANQVHEAVIGLNNHKDKTIEFIDNKIQELIDTLC